MLQVALTVGFLFTLATQVKASDTLQGTCSNVICVNGQMCIVERTRASCVCPKACLNELDPVCSHFLVEYQNLCELHKFACKHELSIGVSRKGPCDVNALRQRINKRVSECPENYLLQFKDRYLEWLSITKRAQSGEFVYKINDDDRGSTLSRDKRQELAQWDFDRWDVNSDGIWSVQEYNTLIDSLLLVEPCSYGFVLSCNYDNNPGITNHEWKTYLAD